MDLIAEEQRDLVFSHKEQEIKASSSAANVSCFKTSIWDETLCVHPPVTSRRASCCRPCCTPVTRAARYKAWSQIVYSLIPNVDQLERQLERFAKTCAADEVRPLRQPALALGPASKTVFVGTRCCNTMLCRWFCLSA